MAATQDDSPGLANESGHSAPASALTMFPVMVASEHLAHLTKREREVAVAIGHGKTNAEISRELYMSVATVKAYLSRLLENLELNNRVQIALLAPTTPAKPDAPDLRTSGDVVARTSVVTEFLAPREATGVTSPGHRRSRSNYHL